jgi:hypothetical protein
MLSANRDTADGERHAELNPEIGEVQESHAGDNPAQAFICLAGCQTHACVAQFSRSPGIPPRQGFFLSRFIGLVGFVGEVCLR